LTAVGVDERHLIEKSAKKGKRNKDKATKPAKVSKTSVNTDVSSSVDLGSVSYSGNDNKCVPSSGTWGGKSFNTGNGPTPFETCYKYGPTGEECWSNSFFRGDGFNYYQCKPKGYTGDNQGWNFLNSGAATSTTCGSPCKIVVDDCVSEGL